MKHIVFILLTSFCATLPAAHCPLRRTYYHDFFVNRYLVIYGMWRLAVEDTLVDRQQNQLRARPHEQQQVPPQHKRQKNYVMMKQQYKNNNRVDRRRHDQMNMRIQQPRERR